MNQILLASHGELAKGMLQTASMLIGELDNIHAFSSYRDDDSRLLHSMNEKKSKLLMKMIIFTY